MTSSANIGAERPSSSSSEAPLGAGLGRDRSPPDGGNAFGQQKHHDPKAEELLCRYLSEIHSYRELGNVALRELEKRLQALSGPDARTAPREESRPSREAPPPRRSLQRSALGAPKNAKLNDRLRELSAYLDADLSRQQKARAASRVEAEESRNGWDEGRRAAPAAQEGTQDAGGTPRSNTAHKAPNAPILDRPWFEERFATMRASIDQLAEKIPIRRLEKLENQFHQLMEKLEARDSNRSMAAVEAGLKKLAAYLEDNKQWTVVQDARMNGVEERLDRLSGLVAQSHAALAETAKGLEIVARGTGAHLAHNTANLVAEKLEPRLAVLDQSEPIIRLSDEVSKISEQSKHFAWTADERLKQLQNCLDEGLDRLDEFENREDPPRSEKSWTGQGEYNAFDDDRDGKTIAAARRAARLADAPADRDPQGSEPVRYHIPYGEFLPAEERHNSRIGLIIAAIILLLASAAMLYLNLRDKASGGSLSSAWLSYVQPEGSAEKVPTAPLTTASVRTEIIEPAPSLTKSESRLTIGASMPAASGAAMEAVPGAHAAAAAEPVAPAGIGPEDEQKGPASLGGDATRDNLSSAAIAGDAEAQFSVGETYLEGRNIGQKLPVAERLSKAARWFRRAAEKGHVPSQYRLATLYELGQGAPKDYAKAMVWYRRAADAGHVKAMHNLAVLSVIGDKRSANYLAAAKWFTKAAEHGLKDSQYNLAVLYERGLGVAKDPAQAYRWFALAAQQGDEKAAQKRDQLAAELSADELRRQDLEMTAWTAIETDAAANSKAPEPPAERPHRVQAAIKPKTTGAQLMKASWSTRIAPQNTIVAEAQRLLQKLDFAPGPVDGILGPRTIAAIRAFERKIGRASTGKLTEALVAKMAFAL